uniref:Uncharacterized protein n=1 Tax=Panagrolaimus sp. ES5 TaxID=591445 RepID=A0AC34GS69_9BILA
MNLTTASLFTILLLIASVAADLPSCSRARCSHCEADLIARLCPQACSTCPRTTLSTTFIAPPKASSIGSKPVVHGQANLNTNTHGELHPLPQAPGPQAQPNSQPQPIYQQQQQPQQPAVNQFQQPYYPQQPFQGFQQQPQQPTYQPQQQQQQQFQGFQQPQQQQYQPQQPQQPQQQQQFGQTPFFNPFQPFLHQSYQAQTPYNPFTFPTFAPVTFAPVTTLPVTVTPTPPRAAPQPQQPLPIPQSPQLPTYQQQQQVAQPQQPQQPQQAYRVDNGNSQKATYYQHRPQGQVQQSKPKQIYNNQQPLSKQPQHVVQPQPQPIQKPYQPQPQQQSFIPPPPAPQVIVQTPQPYVIPQVVPQQVTPAPQPPVYPVPQPAIATSIDAASISAVGASTSDKTCPRPNFEPCISKELANDRFRNCCQRLGEGCASICSYDQTLANVQIAVLTGRCPLSKVADMMVCASGYEDASACCQAYNVFEPGFEQCRPYCNPAAGLPNDGMLAEKYRCLGKMNQIQRCFYVSQRP